MGSLAEGGSDDLRFALPAGRLTQLVGFCDNGCSDMDFTLYDAAGNQVDADVESDDYPVVATRPASGGDYRLVVRMNKCDEAPCVYVVQQFVK